MIATAPGKLILTGEYAVLDGAPALVVAIDRRVVARRRVSPRGSSPFLLAVADELAKQRGPDDPAVHAAVCDGIAAFLAAQGWRVNGSIPSPIAGGDGNLEFFVEAARG